MGAVIEDSFWAPHDVVVEVQDFIADHDRLYTSDSMSEVAMLHSARSAHDWLEAHGFATPHPFWEVGERLVAQHQPFDVITLPDGVLREDTIVTADLLRYRTVILPECSFLTAAQTAAVRGYLEAGGRVIATGTLDPAAAAALEHPNLVRDDEVRLADPQVRLEPSVDLALAIHRVSDKEAAIHVIRYDHDDEHDEVPVLPRMQLDVRLPRPFRTVDVLSPRGETKGRLTFSREVRELHRIELEDVGIYTVLRLR
jgi:hypothetical protein